MNKPQELIDDIRNGKMVILIDDEDRENEGDIVLAADFVSPENINFMIAEARGLVCLALTEKQVKQLELNQMVPIHKNNSSNQTAFTVSIEATEGVSTGISAADRAHTIRVAAHPNAKAVEVSTPGHIFPIMAREGGVLKRAGHTEGSVDLARLAGLNPAAVICEIMNPDGTMARVNDLKAFAKKHDLKIGTIVDLIKYRLQNESLVEKVVETQVSNSFGTELKVQVYRDVLTGDEHLAFIKGQISSTEATTVRMQSQNIIDDMVGGSQHGLQKIQMCLNYFEMKNSGVLIYIQKKQNLEKLLNYNEVDPGMDEKNFGVGAQILKKMGLTQINLITDTPKNLNTLKAFGVEIAKNTSFEALKNELGAETKSFGLNLGKVLL
jgi:3,4-dihydroxy 2-butanone 4-phosphate synthase / GTP cyclohydrolase II